MLNKPQFIAIRSLSTPSKLTSLHLPRRRRESHVNLTIPDGIPDFVHTAQLLAVQDLQTIIAHVMTLFSGDFAEKEGLITRLKNLATAVHQIENGVWQHGFPSGRNYEEYEELCDLESELIDFSSFDFFDEDPESELLSKLVVYWLEEIQCRGYDLFHLLIGAVQHDEVTSSFLALQKVTFPSEPVGS